MAAHCTQSREHKIAGKKQFRSIRKKYQHSERRPLVMRLLELNKFVTFQLNVHISSLVLCSIPCIWPTLYHTLHFGVQYNWCIRWLQDICPESPDFDGEQTTFESKARRWVEYHRTTKQPRKNESVREIEAHGMAQQRHFLYIIPFVVRTTGNSLSPKLGNSVSHSRSTLILCRFAYITY